MSLISTDNDRPSSEDLVAFLRTVMSLGSADEMALREAEKRAHWHILPSRKFLMKQGDPQSLVYLVVSGKLRFERRDGRGNLVACGEISPGDLIGEISLFGDKRAVTTVHSVRDCQLMSLDWPTFEEILLRSPSVLVSLTSKIVKQIDQSLDPLARPERLANIALVPLDPNIPIAEFSSRLKPALEKHGRTLALNRRLIETELGAGRADLFRQDAGYVDNLRFLNRCASQNDFLIYEAEFETTAWSVQCLHEADRVLLVGAKRGDKALSPLERFWASERGDIPPKSELVILHDKRERPAETSAFFTRRSVERHHHLWMEEPSGFERLARVVAGKSVGLALGGGGVRAAAHIGIIRALQGADIPIDHVGGTSIGSVIGAMFAKGASTKEMEEIIRANVVNANLFNDYVPPLVSLVRGRKFSNFLRELLGEQNIEDMPLDYFAVTTNLTEGFLEVRDRGMAWKAVRASASLPGILPPLAENGNLYLDGGLLDNVPGETMRARGAGRVVAVDVGASAKTGGDAVFGNLVTYPGTTPPFWRLFSKRKQYPGLGDVIVRSMVLGSRESAKRIRTSADLYIRVPVENWKMLDFKSTAELIEVGYRHACENLSRWKNSLVSD